MRAETVRRRALSGVLALVGRSALARLITLAGMVVVARLLTPADFGAWELIAFPTLLVTQLTEAGLAEALARMPAAPDARDLGAATLTRLALALAAAAATWLAAPLWAGLYGLEADAIPMLRALAAMHPIAALGTAPGALLLRELQFGRMALAEVAAVLAAQLATVALAAAGYGVWSLAAGALASTVVGTAALWLLRPAGVHLMWSGARARALLSFGGPFTLQGLVHQLREGVIASVGGARLPLAAVGYQRWAYNLSRAPRTVAQAAHQVGLPAFARLQDDPAALGGLATDGVRLVAAVTFPLLAVMAALAPWGVPALFGAAWAGAAPALAVFALHVALESVAAVLLPLLNAVGRAWLALGFSAGWAALTWVAALALVGRADDATALAWAFVVGMAAALGALVLAGRRVAPLALWRAVRLPLGGSLVIGVGLRAAGPAVGQNLAGLIAVAGLALALYAALMAATWRRARARRG